jgi:hypothetical protein
VITLLMRCGHDPIRIDPEKTPTPECWCGEKRIARTVNAERPRIVGHARGPLVESKYLGAIAVNLAVKEQTNG